MKKFDVIIMNPPYQMSLENKGGSDKQIYHEFVLKAISMEPEIICAITPSRWFISDNMKDYRKTITADNKIKKIVEYSNAKECFENVTIKGGVSYIIWDKNYTGDCEVINIRNHQPISTACRNLNDYEIIVRHNDSIKILEKIKSKTYNTFDTLMYSQNPFGLQTNFYEYYESKLEPYENYIKIYTNSQNPDMWIDPNLVTKNKDIIHKYKVILTESYGGEFYGTKPMSILNRPKIAYPNEVCSGSYIVCAVFDTEQEAKNCISYINTKFFRFIVSIIKTTQHNSKNVFKFVPVPDFTKHYEDKFIYELYDISEDEISYIEEIVR